MGFIRDIQDEFNASDNNTTEKYNNNELFTLTSIIENYDNKNLKKDIKKVKQNLKRNKNSIFKFIFIFFGGIMSQLFFRLNDFNGSLDRWWLMLPIFWFPPFSAIPAYYISRRKIKKGNVKIQTFNLNILIAISGSLISLLLKSISRNFYINIISELLPLITLFIGYYLKDCNKCINDTGNNNKKILKTGFSSLLSLSIAIIIQFVFLFMMNKIPFLSLLKPIVNTKLVSYILFTVHMYVSYLIVNCLNNTPSEFIYCKNRKLKQTIPLIFVSLILIIINGLDI